MRALALGLLLCALPAPRGLNVTGPLLPVAWQGTMYVTGYTLPGYTSSGQAVGYGVAACPAWMPLGTIFGIDFDHSGGGPVYTCLDRYAAGLSDRFDVWVPTVAEAYALTGTYRYWVVAKDAVEPAQPSAGS